MLQKHLSHSKDRYRFDTEYFVAHIVILIDLLNAYDMGPMNPLAQIETVYSSEL